MNNGGRSIDQIFSTREILDAVPSIQAAMTKSALQDLTTCLHYSDDWDPKNKGVWDDIYDDAKVVAPPLTGFRLWRQYWRQFWGYIFVGSIFPSKMRPFAPFLAMIQCLSKTRAFLSEKESKVALYGPHLHCRLPVPT
jgi:hypothetical protein